MRLLDTTNPEVIEEYKRNLRSLIAETKNAGQIQKFALIRTDNHLPENWEWHATSMFTQMQKSHCYLTTPIRMKLAAQIVEREKAEERAAKEQRRPPKKKGFFARVFGGSESSADVLSMPASQDVLYAALKKVDAEVGYIQAPSRFRMSKHFTVSTPVSYTGEYNAVETNRNFTIIDNADSFFDSSYAFTADYRDAYLDVTHEPLAVSKEAIILIHEDRINELMQDSKIAEQLAGREVVLFRGDDEGLAINMILAEQGVMPSRFGSGKYAVRDLEVDTIIDNSIKQKCQESGIQFGVPHNEHYSSELSDESHEFLMVNQELEAFLKDKFPGHIDIIPDMPLAYSGHHETYANKLIDAVGIEAVSEALGEFNMQQMQEYTKRNEAYKQQQNEMPEGMKQTFRETSKKIREYFANSDISFNRQTPEMKRLLHGFYRIGSTTKQQLAGEKLNRTLGSVDINLAPDLSLNQNLADSPPPR
jgi:hypothetical protein